MSLPKFADEFKADQLSAWDVGRTILVKGATIEQSHRTMDSRGCNATSKTETQVTLIGGILGSLNVAATRNPFRKPRTLRAEIDGLAVIIDLDADVKYVE